MNYFLPFFTGLGAAVFGTLLPGILNATVVKISKKEGMKHAYSFMAGTFVIIALQTYLAVFFAKIIDSSVYINHILREIGLVVFFVLTIYFLLVTPKNNSSKHTTHNSKKSKRFSQGVFLALLNVFPVFYYAFISVSAVNNKWYNINYTNNLLLTIGVLLGTFASFMFYIQMFKNTVVEESFVLKNINKILGCITGIITLINLYKFFIHEY